MEAGVEQSKGCVNAARMAGLLERGKRLLLIG
jgi:hypothetical protein